MDLLMQFRHRLVAPGGFLRVPFAAALLAFALFGAARLQSQSTQLKSVGQVEGRDISVQGPSAPGGEENPTIPSILVGNGSVVIVHAGPARLTLLSGGVVDICGPAKFTLLEAGGSVTLAVELGRLHIKLPATATLRLYTPTIVATPLEISGGSRDITVGLDQQDSLCVLATSGAIQLEHQFSGEKLIVPQSGEFFLNAGKLLPVVGKPGSCQCAAMPLRQLLPEATQPEEHAANVAPLTAPVPPPPANQPAAGADVAAPPSNVEYSVLAHPNDAHPVKPPEEKKSEPPAAAPPASAPVYTVVAPPLTFSAGSPIPPPDPPIDTYLLVREAQVQPTWEYKGHVDPPTFADAMQQALGESSAAGQPAPEPKKKRGGFWSFWRKIF